MVTIYALCDPHTGEVRYIGKTVKKLSYRRQEHISDKKKTHKTHWIASLLKKGLTPSIKLLEEVADSEWEEAERMWIAYFRKIVFLTNHTDGGEGRTALTEEERKKHSIFMKGNLHCKGRAYSDESRQKISEALTGNSHLLGYIHSDESRKRISASIKAKLKTGWNSYINNQLGKPCSEKRRNAISVAMKASWKKRKDLK